MSIDWDLVVAAVLILGGGLMGLHFLQQRNEDGLYWLGIAIASVAALLAIINWIA